jgi:hypothetical protein
MTKSNFFILLIVSLLFTYSCYVCDPAPSDRFSFYLTKSNENIFNDTTYHIDQVKIYDLNNNTSYQLPLQIDTSRSIGFNHNIYNESKYIIILIKMVITNTN